MAARDVFVNLKCKKLTIKVDFRQRHQTRGKIVEKQWNTKSQLSHHIHEGISTYRGAHTKKDKNTRDI